MQLVDLNDDVVLHICNYLWGLHALQFSLTAKRFYTCAIHRIGITFWTKKFSHLHQFHRYLLNGARAEHLRTLGLYHRVFANDHMPGQSSSGEDSPTRTLVEVLAIARNIRTLMLADSHFLLQHNSQVRSALAALTQIRHVELRSVTDTVLSSVGTMGWTSLHTLSFDDLDTSNEVWTSTAMLVETLAQLPCLRTLKIRGFVTWHGQDPREGIPPSAMETVFPSIRQLFVVNSGVVLAFDLADRCPNIEVFDHSTCFVSYSSNDFEQLKDRGYNRLPPMRSLRAVMEGITSIDSVLNLADHLQLSDEICDTWAPHINELCDTLRVISPVYLQLSVSVMPKPMRFWEKAAGFAPRLRYLDLTVRIDDRGSEFLEECASSNWVHDIPDALRPLPLMYLRLRVAASPCRQQLWACDADTGSRRWNMTEACARTLSRTRSVALQSLPDRCAREIPTLRYFVLSDDGPTNHQIEWDEREFRPLDVKIAAEERRDEEMGAFQDAEDRVDAGGDELEDELRLDECRAYRRTLEEGGRKETLQAWRVVRDGDDGGEGGGCRLVALPYREGKRLHETLVASFDERNPPLSESSLDSHYFERGFAA
ncbi:hypothetical protein C8Q76DRAFT_343209 [Earliella scabrosa]|nr:hypothetical protein C8Q76DRAFT_343209 [Earliella scabrosa]